MITRKFKMYLVYSMYTVKYPTQVTVFNSCRIPEKGSDCIEL